MGVASRNTNNNGREFPVVLGTSEEGTQPRAILNRYFLPDWNLSQYDQTTYDTPIKLTWQLITIKRKLGPISPTVYSGYGWISEPDDDGRQYAIGCANVYGAANPDFFYYNDGTGNLFSVKKAITLSEDGKTITALQGDTTIICSRTGTLWNATNTPVANLTDLPTKTSDLTNDSGFITAAQVPTPDKIEDLSANVIYANRNVQYIEEVANWTDVDYPDNPLNWDADNNWWIANVSPSFYMKLQYNNAGSWTLEIGENIGGEWFIDSDFVYDTQEATQLTFSVSGAAYVLTKGVQQIQTTGELALKSYVDGIVGDINSVLDAINGEVI